MLKGFEEHTKELTKKEVDAAPTMLEFLREAVGKPKAVTNSKIREHLISRGYVLSGSRVRKLINFFRTEFDEMGALVASQKGYWLSKDLVEVEDYITTLTGRINEIRRIKYHVEKHFLKLSNDPQNTIEAEENPDKKEWLKTETGRKISKIIRSYQQTLFNQEGIGEAETGEQAVQGSNPD